LKIDLVMESRELSGKWYTDIKAWKIEVSGSDVLPTSDDSDPINWENLKSDDEILPF